MILSRIKLATYLEHPKCTYYLKLNCRNYYLPKNRINPPF